MEVLINLISDNSDLIIHFVLQGMLAIAILIIGVKVANFFAKLTEITFEKKKIDKTVAGFISNIIHALVFAATVLMALSQVGIETTSFVAILGAAGLAVGLALQGSLSNFASGVLIIVLRPFKSGDYIEAGGQAGSVERIEIFATELRTPDNKVIIMPNSAIMSGAIVNYSRQKTRRIDLVIGVSYESDLKQAKAALISVLDIDTRILKEPEYTVAVSELADSSVNFVVRPWVKTEDYWPAYFDLVENIKITLDEANIAIPYPQMDVHLHKD